MENKFKDKKVFNSEQSEESRFRDKRVLIFGLGLNMGGVGSAKFFASVGAQVKVTDLKTKDELKNSLEELKDYPNIEYVLGSHNFEDFDWADLIIKNPAIKSDNKYLIYAKEKGKRVEMDMGIFLDFINPKQIIGVTGTKGKSTTSSLIYEVLKQTHQDVVLAGNIGVSVLDSLPQIKENSLVVLELSSFQLASWGEHKVSPHIAVVTNIFEDHLNYYENMEEYIQDKRYITQNQTDADYLFLLKGDKITNDPKFLEGLKAKIIYFSSQDLPADFSPQLPGEHNRANMAGALAVAKILNIPESKTLESMKNFKGVEFRMQLIKEWHGIKIYNDTTATNPQSATFALQSFPKPILVTGGLDAGLSYESFSNEIDNLAPSVFFLEGTATDKIKEFMKDKSKIKGTFNNFDDLLAEVKKVAGEGDIILFSPGAKSFNLFQNEFDRGRKFNQSVEQIFK